MIKSVEYKGKTYTRRNKMWVNKYGEVINETAQRKLDEIVFESINVEDLSYDEALEFGDEFKGSGSFDLALELYKRALNGATFEAAKYILPRVTSSLRGMKKSDVALELYVELNELYGESIVDNVLLTSVAAAYCDRSMFDDARRCVEKALEMSNGVPHYYIESDFWDDREYSEEALRTRVESICQILHNRKEG